MYRIGEFSRITNLSIKTLRYYDEEGLLKPSCRNEANGYRYYNEDDFQRAQMLSFLRSLDFSIAEMKDVMETCSCKDDLHFYLEEKHTLILAKMKEQKQLLKRLETYMEPKINLDKMPTYEISEITLPQMLVASFRTRKAYHEVGTHVSMMYKEIKGCASGDAMFNLYYDEDYQEIADMETCIPLRKSFTPQQLEIRTLPSIKGITLTHVGRYDTLNIAYKALLDYAKQHHYELIRPSREIYIKGPGKIFKGNPDTYITQIVAAYTKEEEANGKL